MFLDSKRDWVVNGGISGSRLPGSTEAITRLQDERRSATSTGPMRARRAGSGGIADGWTGSVNLNRNAGVHRVNAALWGVSPGFDSSDAGFTFEADRAGMHAVYQWREPGGEPLRAPAGSSPSRSGTPGTSRAKAGGRACHVRQHGVEELLDGVRRRLLVPRAQDDRATRGGPSMLAAGRHSGSIGVESDGRKRCPSARTSARTANDAGGWSGRTGLNVRYRPAASLEISAGPSFERSTHRAVRRHLRGSGGGRHLRRALRVLDRLKQREFSLQTRVNYVMSPKMSLQVYMQPLVSVGHYTGFKEFARPRTFDFTRYGQRAAAPVLRGERARYTVDPGDGGAGFEFDDPDFNSSPCG